MRCRIDRRAHIRQSVQVPAQVRSSNAGGWPARVCDLSTTGARVLTVGHVAPADHLVLTMDVANGARKVFASGTAVRVTDLEPERNWAQMVAVEFDAPLNETAESAVAWLAPTGF